MGMQTHPLGDKRPSVVLGTMGMTGYYGQVDAAAATATIRHFLDLGGHTIDTADLYADGANETLVGRAIAGRRDAVTLCTKFGYTFGETAAQRGLDARPERVQACCEASLRRLGVEQIDLYYLHRVDPKVPVQDTWGAMARLVEQGKVRALGLCEVGPVTFASAAAVHPVAAVQSEYSLWSREPEEGVLNFCAEQGAWFMGYAALGRGFLSGALRSPDDIPPGDQRRDMPRFQGENFTRNLHLVQALQELAAQRGVAAASLAVAWCRRKGWATPIVGATVPAHVDDALAAVALQLPQAVWDAIDSIFPPGAAAGQRYPEAAMRRLQGNA